MKLAITIAAFALGRHGCLLHAAGTEGFEPADDSRGTGVILWAHGRSATDTFAHTLLNTAGWSYCRGKKEAFKSKGLSEIELRTCIERRELLVHVKPMHLTAAGSQLSKPSMFFAAAKRAGFGTVVSVFRENQLAWWISSFENNLENQKVRAVSKIHAEGLRKFGKRNMVSSFQHFRQQHVDGISHAKKLGFRVVSLSFKDVTDALCPSVQAALQGWGSTKPTPCVSATGHTGASHRGDTLAHRIGSEAAEAVTSQLKGTKYEWMLVLQAESREDAVAMLKKVARAKGGNKAVATPTSKGA